MATTRQVLAATAATALFIASCADDGASPDAAGPASPVPSSPAPLASPTVGAASPSPTEELVEVPTVDLEPGGELELVAGFFGHSSNNLGGFAVAGEEITSPGPTLRVRKGETVTITFENAHVWEDGKPFGEPHNLVVVADKDARRLDLKPLWGAKVGGFGEDYLPTGERGSVTFTAETAGEFHYVCSVGDHIAHGMWGRFVVEE